MMIIEGSIIKAEQGSVLKRKGTDEIYGEEISLGYSYYINGVKLEEPHLDTPDDFEEVLCASELIKILTESDEEVLDED